MTARFAGRVALVTGGAGGIGAETVRRLAAAGGAVAVLDRDQAALEVTVAAILASGGKAVGIAADVTSVAEVEAAVARVVADWGKLDILVNNAGIYRLNSVIDATDQEFAETIDVNLRGPFVCIRAVAPVMIENGYGRIVTVSSRAHLGEPLLSIYSASKAALHGLSASVALELGPYGITVNLVAPGAVATPLLASLPDHAEQKQRIASSVPMRRMGEPADVAEAILFLASEEAGYITSEVLYVTGGRYHGGAATGLGDRVPGR